METNMMEKNMFLGGNVSNPELRLREIKIDKENAEKDAFGEGVSEEEARKMEFEYFRDALKVVRKEGLEADSRFSMDLKEEISQELNIDKSQIKIFNAKNTPLDRFHRVSAFVDINDASAKDGKITITLDVFTESRNRRDGANVVFRQPDSGFNSDKNNEQYDEILKEVTSGVVKRAKEIKSKIGASRSVSNFMDSGNKSIRVVTFDSQDKRN